MEVSYTRLFCYWPLTKQKHITDGWKGKHTRVQTTRSRNTYHWWNINGWMQPAYDSWSSSTRNQKGWTEHLVVSLSLHLEIYSSRHQYVRDSFLKTLLTCIQDWPVLFGKTILRLQSDINIFSGITVIAFGDLIQSPSVCQRFFFEDTTDLYTRLASSLWQDHFKIAEWYQHI